MPWQRPNIGSRVNRVPYLKKGGYKVKREHYDPKCARSHRGKGSGGELAR